MKILVVASECTPIAKVGGLGDVIGSLPKALNQLGCDVRIAVPKYQIIDSKKYKTRLVASDVKVREESVNIYETFLPDSRVSVYLLENEKYFGQNGVYFEKTAFVRSFEEIKRFLFFSETIVESLKYLDWRPDIIHCNDWHTAILPLLLKVQIKNLLTIHNLANQGKWSAIEILRFLNLKGNETESLKKIDEKGNLNIFEQGILNADILNTVSINYAKEIQTKEYGEGLEKDLLGKKSQLFGILNGIDQERFNPTTDPDLKVNYSSETIDRKRENKIDLQDSLGLPKDKAIPLIGAISRLTSQKGVDLIIGIIPKLVNLNCQLVVLGVGEETYEKELSKFAQEYPKNISIQIKFDPVLAQKIYAGADIFLMPSKFEPCGLGQMIAMRYGTIPIVRRTGGLAETVKNKKTGFVFAKYNKEFLLKVVKEALRFYKNKDEWYKLQKNAMNQDFSWQKSAKEYLKLYEKLLKN